MENFFEELDDLGVVVVMATGNDGYNEETGEPDSYQADSSPQGFVTDESSFIVVGATYHDGSIAEFTTPPGVGPDDSDQSSSPGAPDPPRTLDTDGMPSISIWAQGVGVYSCNPKSAQSPMGFHSGTSFAAPQVVSCNPPTRVQKHVSGIRLLMVLRNPGWPCCIHAFVPLARGSEPFQPGGQSLSWSAHEDDAC